MSELPVHPASTPSTGAEGSPSSDAASASAFPELRAACLEALKVVRDPEIPVNIVDLGLVYRLEADAAGAVEIDMTLTSMGCPVQDMIQADAELACMKVDGVSKVSVNFVWSPPWGTDKMSEDGKKQMRMFGFHV